MASSESSDGPQDDTLLSAEELAQTSSIYDGTVSPHWDPRDVQWHPTAITEPVKKIPITVDPHEIVYTPDRPEGEEQAFEQKWAIRDIKDDGAFEDWYGLQTIRDSQIERAGNVRALPITILACRWDTQTILDTLFGRLHRSEKTFGTMKAPLGEENGEIMHVDVDRLAPHAVRATLMWVGEDAETKIDLETAQEACKQLHITPIEMERFANACVVYHGLRQTPEDIKRLQDAQCANVQSDIVTGEKVRTYRWQGTPDERILELRDRMRAEYLKARDGEKVDIRDIMTSISKGGPILNWIALLPEEQRQQLGSADFALMDEISNAFQNAYYAERIRQLLSIIDTGLEAQIHPYVSGMFCPDSREEVQSALQLWEDNKHNVYRNYYLGRKKTYPQMEGADISDYPLASYNQHPSFFSVAELHADQQGDTLTARYVPAQGILYVRALAGLKYDFPVLISIVQELVRIVQHHDAIGETEDHAANHEAYSKRVEQRFLADDEKFTLDPGNARAWSNSIELLVSRLGEGQHTYMSALDTLEIARPSEIEEVREETPGALKGRTPDLDALKRYKIRPLMGLAEPYFKGGGRIGDTYPSKFIETLEAIHNHPAKRTSMLFL